MSENYSSLIVNSPQLSKMLHQHCVSTCNNRYKISVFFFMYSNITNGKNKTDLPITHILVFIISEQTFTSQGQEKLDSFSIIIYIHIYMLLHVDWLKLYVVHNYINVPKWLSHQKSLKCDTFYDLQVTLLNIRPHSRLLEALWPSTNHYMAKINVTVCKPFAVCHFQLQIWANQNNLPSSCLQKLCSMN